MRAHPAAVRGVARQHVVQPRVGNETEPPQQRVRLRHVQVEPVHQQRPARARQPCVGGGRKRALAQRPVSAAAHEQPGLHVLVRGQAHQFRGRHDAAESWHRLSHEHRLFLPILRQE